MSPLQHEVPDSSLQVATRTISSRASTNTVHPETEPLLVSTGPSTQHHHNPNNSRISLYQEDPTWNHYRSSPDQSFFFDFIMEKVKSTKAAYFLGKLAVENEPGLTNAQLMLHNHDLKPVEPERRQWGPWNFVGFWVADSFNIVGCKFS